MMWKSRVDILDIERVTDKFAVFCAAETSRTDSRTLSFVATACYDGARTDVLECRA